MRYGCIDCVKETCLSTGLGNRTKLVDKVGLGHADIGIVNGENFVLLVRSETARALSWT